MSIIPDNFIIQRSESRVNPKTKICDEDYNVLLQLNKSFTDTQIREVVNLLNIFYSRGLDAGKKGVQEDMRQALGIFIMGDRVDIGEAKIDINDLYS